MPPDKEPAAPTFLLHRHFGDFDEFCENVVQWDLDYQQIERGGFHSELLIVGSGQIQFSRARLGRRLIQKGAPPAGMRTFALLAASSIEIFWRGQVVNGDELFVFPVGGELDSVTQGDFDVFCVSLPDDVIAGVSQSLGLPDLDSLLNRNEVFRLDPDDMRQLRRLVVNASHELTKNVGAARAEGLGRLAVESSRLLLQSLSRARLANKPRRYRRRAEVLRQVDEYLSTDLIVPPCIEDLCKAAKVSERTLEYAFRDHYGLTPKAYINARRLNSTRRALLTGDPATNRVLEIAQAQGFWHMSQFAADYRALFGELPSHTLRRTIG